MKKAILISIHKRHLENILRGEKFFEYRKALPEEAGTLVFYCTAPVARVVAVAEVCGQMQMSPTGLWERTSHGSGIPRRFYREYFQGRPKAGAFVLGKVRRLQRELPLSEIGGDCVPPMSFSYLGDKELNVIEDQGRPKPVINPAMVFVGGIPDPSGNPPLSLNADKVNSPGFGSFQASELIRRGGNTIDPSSREFDIDSNQQALLGEIRKTRPEHFKTVVYGHYTIAKNNKETIPIKPGIFSDMKPDLLVLIKKSLDDLLRPAGGGAGLASGKTGLAKTYEELARHLEREESHAKEVAKAIDTPLEIIERPTTPANFSRQVFSKIFQDSFEGIDA